MTYSRFLAMIATSTIIMFGLMYLNTWDLSHVWFSQTRMWMALYMGAVMALVMLAFMLGMYTNRKANISIFVVPMIAFSMGLYLVRSQDTVGDVAWMKGIIPHHSIAILTSSRAKISDPRARELADDITEAQLREIVEMDALIAVLNGDPTATTEIGGNNQINTVGETEVSAKFETVSARVVKVSGCRAARAPCGESVNVVSLDSFGGYADG